MKDALLRQILGRQGVLPIMTIRNVESALRIAESLLAGGLARMEITLRTAEGPAGIRAIRDRFPEITVGAGTLLQPDDFDRAEAAGAQFAISPGLTPALIAMAVRSQLPFLPGVQTASEVMVARENGLKTLKFYPARAAGGTAVLADFGSIFPDVLFVPTGKVLAADVPAYLALANVLTVGSGWVTPPDRVAAHDWPTIVHLAEQAAKLTKS